MFPDRIFLLFVEWITVRRKRKLLIWNKCGKNTDFRCFVSFSLSPESYPLHGQTNIKYPIWKQFLKKIHPVASLATRRLRTYLETFRSLKTHQPKKNTLGIINLATSTKRHLLRGFLMVSDKSGTTVLKSNKSYV